MTFFAEFDELLYCFLLNLNDTPRHRFCWRFYYFNAMYHFICILYFHLIRNGILDSHDDHFIEVTL